MLNCVESITALFSTIPIVSIVTFTTLAVEIRLQLLFASI